MTLLTQTIQMIQPVSEELDDKIKNHIDDLTKPLGALGKLEELAFRYARIRAQVVPEMPIKRLYTFAADHGVNDEGVSAYPKEVTLQMVANMAQGGAAINVFGRHATCDVKVVDIGVDGDLTSFDGVMHYKIRRGTRNFKTSPAMDISEAISAMEVGIRLAGDANTDGVTLMGTGEMGIGNTTAASALMQVLLPCKIEEIVGRGTGIDDDGIARKRAVIDSAIKYHGLNDGNTASDPLQVLAAVGGLEIAGMAGLILGCAANRVAVIIDGFIASAAALVAFRLAPEISDYLIFSHQSAEQGHRLFLKEMQVRPLFDLGLRLGEGTGAALAMNLVDAAIKMMREMATFSSAGVSGELAITDEGAA